MTRWRIYEYIEMDGQSCIGKWLKEKDIQDRDRGTLRQKMDMLAQHGMDLPPGLLAGPIASKVRRDKLQSHVYKLVIHGQRMLRPLLCRGPINTDAEFTLLIGAIEKGGVLDVDVVDAENRRQEVVMDPINKRRLNGRYR